MSALTLQRTLNGRQKQTLIPEEKVKADGMGMRRGGVEKTPQDRTLIRLVRGTQRTRPPRKKRTEVSLERLRSRLAVDMLCDGRFVLPHRFAEEEHVSNSL